ncbi:MAG TPA: hypothetical protein VER17_19610 [Tepidisphaeraceae bacterium]|nr:hypothetical protein [Tepidisphaeraceae bacterium]
MGWGRMLLLGDFGQQMDIHEMRQAIEMQSTRDAGQDQSIDALYRENQDLKLAFTALAALLVRKGIVSADEVKEIGREMER